MIRQWHYGLFLGILMVFWILPGGGSVTAGILQSTGIRIAARQSLVITVPAHIEQVTSDNTQVAEAILLESGDRKKSQILIHGRSPGNTRLVLWTGDTGQPMAVMVSAPQKEAPPSALLLNTGTFRIIKVISPIRRVAVGDETIAGVLILPTEKPGEQTISLLIDGRSPGVTNLLIWTGQGVDSLKVAVR